MAKIQKNTAALSDAEMQASMRAFERGEIGIARYHGENFRTLILARSPEQIARMEIARGLRAPS